jgi:hypothetical protein
MSRSDADQAETKGDHTMTLKARQLAIARRFKAGRTLKQLNREFGRHVVDRAIRRFL